MIFIWRRRRCWMGSIFQVMSGRLLRMPAGDEAAARRGGAICWRKGEKTDGPGRLNLPLAGIQRNARNHRLKPHCQPIIAANPEFPPNGKCRASSGARLRQRRL